jgi:hypothetical protein
VRKFVSGIVLVIALSGFLVGGKKTVPTTRNNSYTTGEELEYRVHLAFFTVGKASTHIDKKLHKVANKTCYKVEGAGKTADWISWVSKFDDIWGAYIDTTSLLAQVSYRKLQEGNYRRDETVTFDHEKDKAEVKVKNNETGKDEIKVYDVPHNTKDLVSGFLHLRIVDFRKLAPKDTIVISGFLEDKAYSLKIIYVGKEIIHTKVGKIPCIKLRPVMPANSLFDGEDSIFCWISDDLNRIPVKLQAKMFIGSAGLELISFRGLRNQLKMVF